jgi:ABC-type branched-subunit amino acid transport system permease subunit
MKLHASKGLRAGVIFGIIVLYLMLTGFVVIISSIIGNFLNLDTTAVVGNYAGLMVFISLIGLFGGANAANEGDEQPTSWGQALFSGALAGLVSGLLTLIFLLLVGTLSSNGVDFRKYLAQLSAEAIDLLLLGNSPIIGSLLQLGLLTISAVIGATLSKLGKSLALGRKFGEWRKSTSESISNTALSNITTTPAGKYFLYGLFLLVILAIPQFAGQYWNFILGTVGIYVLMGLGLNIVVGLAGLLDLGYVAFFAVGAYTMGLLTAPEPLGLELNFWLVLPIAVIISALAGVLLGIPVLRLRGDYLAIVTLGFGEIIRVLVKSDLLAPVLGGPQGVRDIAGPTIFGRSFNSEQAFLYLILLGILLVIFVTIQMQHSRVGRSWIAMREDETVAQAMGLNTYKAKLLAFAIGAAFAGLGGLLFASRNQYTGPEDHNLLVSINVLSIVIVGGMGSIPGVILGAFALKGLPEILRQIEDYRILAFGGLLVIMMIVRPEGLWPAKRRSLEIHSSDEEELPE